jgi:hypothetical protein
MAKKPVMTLEGYRALAKQLGATDGKAATSLMVLATNVFNGACDRVITESNVSTVYLDYVGAARTEASASDFAGVSAIPAAGKGGKPKTPEQFHKTGISKLRRYVKLANLPFADGEKGRDKKWKLVQDANAYLKKEAIKGNKIVARYEQIGKVVAKAIEAETYKMSEAEIAAALAPAAPKEKPFNPIDALGTIVEDLKAFAGSDDAVAKQVSLYFGKALAAAQEQLEALVAEMARREAAEIEANSEPEEDAVQAPSEENSEEETEEAEVSEEFSSEETEEEMEDA